VNNQFGTGTVSDSTFTGNQATGGDGGVVGTIMNFAIPNYAAMLQAVKDR